MRMQSLTRSASRSGSQRTELMTWGALLGGVISERPVDMGRVYVAVAATVYRTVGRFRASDD